MKKKLCGIIACLLVAGIMLTGCSDTSGVESESASSVESIVYADESFIEDFSQGLQARWALNAQDEESEGYEDIEATSEEYKEMIIKYIDVELDYVEKYTDEKFEDSNLQQMAITYVNLLKEHKDVCSYLTVDFDTYYEEYQAIYNERSKIISEMVSDYGMTVEEEYQSTLDDFWAKATLVVKNEEIEEAINSLVASIQFEEVEDDGYGWKTYQAIVENSTDEDFSYFSLTINLLDADGIIVETTYDSVDEFASGAKAKFEFMTDEEFESTEITVDYSID